jgi:hypothetical protein
LVERTFEFYRQTPTTCGAATAYAASLWTGEPRRNLLMAQSVARHHAEWLSLVEVSGPFLTLPVLQRAFPQGLEDTDPELAATLRRAYEEWQADPTLHGQWVRWVLGTLLGFVPQVLVDGPAVPAALAWQVPEHGETLRPALAVLDPVGNGERHPRLLVTVWPDEQKLNDPLPEARWAASPLDRMVELLRGTGVRLGLVTNGERWTLVDAPRGATAGFATWEAGIWQEERSALNAFRGAPGRVRQCPAGGYRPAGTAGPRGRGDAGGRVQQGRP